MLLFLSQLHNWWKNSLPPIVNYRLAQSKGTQRSFIHVKCFSGTALFSVRFSFSAVECHSHLNQSVFVLPTVLQISTLVCIYAWLYMVMYDHRKHELDWWIVENLSTCERSKVSLWGHLLDKRICCTLTNFKFENTAETAESWFVFFEKVFWKTCTSFCPMAFFFFFFKEMPHVRHITLSLFPKVLL